MMSSAVLARVLSREGTCGPRGETGNDRLRASVGSTEAANEVVARFDVIGRERARPLQDKTDEVVQTPVARLSGRAASRATNAYAVRAAEIVLTD
jgi:hypothetical protein